MRTRGVLPMRPATPSTAWDRLAILRPWSAVQMDLLPVKGCFDCCSQASRSCMQQRQAFIIWVLLEPLSQLLVQPPEE